jgi:HTH-type transcriptional regulator, competence development regulator
MLSDTHAMADRTKSAPAQEGSLGEALRRIRLVAGRTLRDIETSTGVSNAYLSQLENGTTKNPSPQVLYKLSAAYGVPYESLMELAGHLRPSPNAASQRMGALQAALMSAHLTPEEEARVAEFIGFLRSQRRRK